MQSSFAEAVGQQKFAPVTAPKIEPLNFANGIFESGVDLKYRAVFEIFPVIELKGEIGISPLSVSVPLYLILNSYQVDGLGVLGAADKITLTGHSLGGHLAAAASMIFPQRVNAEVFAYNAPGFDPRQYGLYPVRVETWRGLVFVNLDLAAAPLADALGPLSAAAALPPFPLVERRSHNLACNWKAYVENYLEGYHLPMVHPEFDADVVVADYRVAIEGQVIFHSAPPRDASVYAGTWAWLWPNLAINTYRHGYMIERMAAVGPEETRLDYFYFFDPARTAELAEMLKVSDLVTAQDKQVCEEVQRNLRTGIYRGGVLSPKHEHGVAWFQARVTEAHGEPEPARLAAAS